MHDKIKKVTFNGLFYYLEKFFCLHYLQTNISTSLHLSPSYKK